MRISLIVKDKTGVELYQEAANQKISMGKYLNQIIEARDKSKPQEKPIPQCAICGGVPTRYGVTILNEKVFFCSGHAKYAKYFRYWGAWAGMTTPTQAPKEKGEGGPQ